MNRNHQLLINLAFLGTKYTGLTTYTKNLIPQLANLNPTLITSNSYPDFNTYPVSANLTQEQGTKGNIKRLIWTETQLYQTYQQLKVFPAIYPHSRSTYLWKLPLYCHSS